MTNDNKYFKSTTIELFGKTFEASHKHSKNINNNFLVFLGFIKYYSVKSLFISNLLEVIFGLLGLFTVFTLLVSFSEAINTDKDFYDIFIITIYNVSYHVVVGIMWGFGLGLMLHIVGVILLNLYNCFRKCFNNITNKLNDHIPDIEESFQ